MNEVGWWPAQGAFASALRAFSAGKQGPSVTRRQLLGGFGLTLLGAVCTRAGTPAASSPPPGSIDSLLAGAKRVSVLGTGADAPPMNPGRNRLGLILVTPQNSVIEGGTAPWRGWPRTPGARPWARTRRHSTSSRPMRGRTTGPLGPPARTVRHGDRAAGRGDLERGGDGHGTLPSLRGDRGPPGDERGDPRPARIQGDPGPDARWPRRWPRSRRSAPGRQSVTCTTSRWRTPSPAASPR